MEQRFGSDLVFDAGRQNNLRHFIADQILQISHPLLLIHRHRRALIVDVFQSFIHPRHHGDPEFILIPMSDWN